MSGEEKLEKTHGPEAATPQCQFFVQRKKRLCRMTVKPGRHYCGEHEPQPKTEIGQTDKRIPCPNDPKHTVYSSKLLKHLAICNARRTEQPPYIIENINAPEAVETCPRLPLSSYPKDVLANVIDKVNYLYAKHVEGQITEEPPSPIHRAVLPEFSEADRAESSLRHLRQVSALLWCAERAQLCAKKTCYVELGAGKGQLSYYAAHAWCGGTGSRVLAIDRAPLRHKRDNKLRSAPPTHHTDIQSEEDRTSETNMVDHDENIESNSNKRTDKVLSNPGSNRNDLDESKVDNGSSVTNIDEIDDDKHIEDNNMQRADNGNKIEHIRVHTEDRAEQRAGNGYGMEQDSRVQCDANENKMEQDKIHTKDGVLQNANVNNTDIVTEDKDSKNSIVPRKDVMEEDTDDKQNQTDNESDVSKREVVKLSESRDNKVVEDLTDGGEKIKREGGSEGGEVAVRLRADLAHLALEAVPVVTECDAVVGLAKHLCGVATDYALRCIAAAGVARKTRGLVLATCCHHRVERGSYVGNQQLQELGITAEDFNVMLGLVSWATCGDGRSRERRQLLQETGDGEQETANVFHKSGLTQEAREQTGRRAKALLDWGRVLWLRARTRTRTRGRGLDARLAHYVPRHVSPENVALVAVAL